MRIFSSLLAAVFSLIMVFASSGAEWTISTDFGVGNGVEVTGISAADENNVWAVVNYDSPNLAGDGEIFYYNGTNWFLDTATYSVQTGEHRAVYAYDSSNVWVVGNSKDPEQGRIYYYNGSIWTLQTDNADGSSILYSVYADASTSVWVSGNSGRIHHSSDGGINWIVSTDTGSEVWQAIHGLDGSNIWVVGSANPTKILFWNGSEWSVQTEVDLGHASAYLRGIFAISSDDVWAAGDLGIVLNYDGGSWIVSADFTEQTLFNYAPVSAQTASQVWAAPRNSPGSIFYFNGSDWSTATTLGALYDPVSLDATAPGEVWAGTERSRVYHYDIPPPTPTPTPIYVTQDWTLSTDINQSKWTRSVAAGNSSNVWVPSSASGLGEGDIFYFDGSSWSVQTTVFSVQTGTFRGCYAYGPSYVWAVGNSQTPTKGRIYAKRSGAWELQTQLEVGSTYLYDAFATSSLDAWAVGNAGYIYNTADGGNTWAVQSQAGTGIWQGIHGTDSSHLWVVGDENPALIAYFDGSVWSIQCEVDLGSGKYLRDVTAVTQTDVWAVGDTGAILHYDDSGDWIIAERVGDTSNYAGISAQDADNIWTAFAGSGGGIYYYDGDVWAKVLGVNLSSAYAVDASVPYEVWATGDSDEVWHYQIPTPTPSPTTTPVPTETPTPSTTPTAYVPSPTPTPTPATTPSPSVTPTPEGWVCELILDFSTYLGGSSNDQGQAITVNTDNQAYIVGYTNSVDFPTAGIHTFQAELSGVMDDCFLTKLTSTGSDLVFSTYFGGSGNDHAFGVGLDVADYIYITGETDSSDFPTRHQGANPLIQAAYGGGGDAFVTQFHSTGTGLWYSTYLGGTGEDVGRDIKVAGGFRGIVIGETDSTDFPTRNPYQAANAGGTDIFVSKVGFNAETLDFSTYLGGYSGDWGKGIDLCGDDSVYLTGYTYCNNFPTINAYQSSRQGDIDTFITKLNSDGDSLAYSTFLGGDSYDYGYGIAVGPDDYAHVAGYTRSTDTFPVANAYQSTHGGNNYDAFVVKTLGDSLVYSTYLGGSGNEQAYRSIAVDDAGNTYVGGYTNSPDFPTVNPYQAAHDSSWDIFVSEFNPQGSDLICSTYLGAGGIDYCYGLALDNSAGVYLTGYTSSGDFPVSNPYQSTEAGGTYDAFVSKLTLSCHLTSPTPTSSPTPSATPTVYVPSPTPTPTLPLPPPTITPPGASPTPTIIACFNVSGVVRNKITHLPISGASVRVVYTGGTTATTLSSPTGFYNRYPCTSSPTGVVTGQARCHGYLPSFSSKPYVNWSEVTGLDIELVPSSMETGVSAGDFDGDGTSDIAIFRGSSALWAIRGITRVYFGTTADDLVTGDFDGDGNTDLGVFRASSGLWAIRGLTRLYFGDFSDVAIPSDLNGNGTSEICIFRSSSGLWVGQAVTRVYFGTVDDQPLAGNYDGDGTGDIGIFRAGSSLWALRNISRIYFGDAADRLVPGDYDGSGIRFPSIFRPSSGLWAIRGLTRLYFGSSTDREVPADYDGDGTSDIGIFRPSSGLWAGKDITRTYFGQTGDVPVTR